MKHTIQQQIKTIDDLIADYGFASRRGHHTTQKAALRKLEVLKTIKATLASVGLMAMMNKENNLNPQL